MRWAVPHNRRSPSRWAEGRGAPGERGSEKGRMRVGDVTQQHSVESLGHKGHSTLGPYSHKTQSYQWMADAR